MNLLYKTWCETRVRLAFAAALLAGVCAVILVFQHGPRQAGGEQMPYATYVWNSIYKDYVRNLFVVLVLVLGGGTVLQERSLGTSGFTLALPVSRARLLMMRAIVGLLEMIALAVVPAIVIPVIAMTTGERYPLRQAGSFALLWIAGGVVLFGLAVLCASFIANEYAAWLAAFLVLMLYEALANLSALSRLPSFDVLRMMSGSGREYLDTVRHVIVGPLPWTTFAVSLVIGGLALMLSERLIQRKDF